MQQFSLFFFWVNNYDLYKAENINMKYYVIAGEASGDLHASNLMRALKTIDKEAIFKGWGGDLMRKQGLHLVKHYKETAYMGFVEVIKNIRTILKNIQYCKKDILNFNPDVVILVDYPGFNLRIAKFTHTHKIKTFYYISPQIWAWKQSRIRQIKRDIDRMFVILPFEKQFYEKFNMVVDFVGHPLLDAFEQKNFISRIDFLEKNNLADKPIIALLPGSRKMELEKILPPMVKTSSHFPNYQFVIAGVNSLSHDDYRKHAPLNNIPIVWEQTYDLLSHSEAALVKSGTSTLETALIGTPEIVCYKGNYLSYLIAKRLIKVPYISLVNLIAEKKVVNELIQNDLTPKNINQELKKILFNASYRDEMLENLNKIKELLKGRGASNRAAQLMYSYLIKD